MTPSTRPTDLLYCHFTCDARKVSINQSLSVNDPWSKCCFWQIYCRSLIQSGWLTLTIGSSAQKGTKVNWEFTWCHFIEKNIPNLFSVSGQWWPTHQIIKNSMVCQSLCLFKHSMQRCIKPQLTNSHTINPLSYSKNSLAGLEGDWKWLPGQADPHVLARSEWRLEGAWMRSRSWNSDDIST